MRERLFDSGSTDSIRAHRMGYQVDCGTVHAIGNGDIMVYGRGPEWLHLCGAPYSCPPTLSLAVPDGDAVTCVSCRRDGVGSWEHRLPQGRMIDCGSRAYRCVARQWKLTAPLTFEADSHGFPMQEQGNLLGEGTLSFLITLPAYTAVHLDYPLGKRSFITLCLRGGVAAEKIPCGYRLTLSGEGYMIAVGSTDYAENDRLAKVAIAVPFEDILADADKDDRAFLKECALHRAPLREHPLSARAKEAADEVALLIRAQQANCGGVQAGHNYHMAYIRDQYGVSRGLLAVGAWDNARAILEFYRGVFARYGCLHNAQGIDTEKVFHIHENDLTEITGYLVLQTTDYYAVTGDTDFFCTLLPMVNWALDAELSQLHNGMMPFNGDETYIAGRIVPRTLINHGSFEATLLFLTGTERYLAVCDALGIAVERRDALDAAVKEVKAGFEANFRRQDGYVCNSLLRLNGLTEPEYRHGVCYFQDFVGNTRRVAEGCYVCAGCLNRRAEVVPCREEYHLKSTFLMVPFIGADRIGREELRQTVAAFLADYRKTGKLPSLPRGDRCLGYDFGLLLHAAADVGLEADDLLEHTMRLADEAGSWPEYFEGDEPKQTRCRPWESGINIVGILDYLKA